ncbi:MAG: hypothetical protein IPL39_05505 [Opitutaceae bacterium]|nr:hypothetical protein [Opitutaceae bacterium]
MKATAKLTELMDSMEMQSEDWLYRYDRKTGKVAMVERSTYHAIEAQEDEDLDESDEEVVLARAMVEDAKGRFIDLPDKFDFHEYHQMERFIRTVEDAAVADELWRAIKGKGAFRYFKDVAARHGLLDAWYRFLDEAAKAFVIRWAEFNEVPFEDDTAGRRK